MATARKLVTFADFSRLACVSRAAVTKAASTILAEAVEGTRVDIEHPSAVDYVLKRKEQTLYDEALYFISSTQNASVRSLMQELRIAQRAAQALLRQFEAEGVVSAAPSMPGQSRTVFIKDVPKPKGKRRAIAPPDPVATPAAKSPKKRKQPEHDLPTYEPDQDLGPLREMKLGKLLELFGTSERFHKWLTAAKRIEEIHGSQIKNAAAKGDLISRDMVRTHIFGMIDDSHKRLLTDEPRALSRRVSSLIKSGAPLEEVEQAIRDSLSKQLRNVKATATRVLKK